jgi:hypothetical protein
VFIGDSNHGGFHYSRMPGKDIFKLSWSNLIREKYFRYFNFFF